MTVRQKTSTPEMHKEISLLFLVYYLTASRTFRTIYILGQKMFRRGPFGVVSLRSTSKCSCFAKTAFLYLIKKNYIHIIKAFLLRYRKQIRATSTIQCDELCCTNHSTDYESMFAKLTVRSPPLPKKPLLHLRWCVLQPWRSRLQRLMISYHTAM